MQRSISEDLLAAMAGKLASRTGLHFTRDRWRELESGLLAASREEGCARPETFVRKLLAGPLSRSRIESLARHLTVGETYFFRDPQCFAACREFVLEEVIRQRAHQGRNLRLWSAGCSSGEEAYSLAVCLHQIIPDLADWNVTILATDINPRVLEQAQTGIYREWSFRGGAGVEREKYFRPQPPGWQVIPSLRRLVVFEYLNLAEDAYPSLLTNTNAMGVIFCRNVLMYFEPERARRVVERLYHALVDGGWLVVSPAELSQNWFARFQTVNFPGAIFYRKPAGTSADEDPVSLPSAWGAPEQPALFPAGEGVMETAPRPPEPVTPIPVRPPRKPPPPVVSTATQARDCANRGELDTALEWAGKAIGGDKSNAALYYLRATILQEKGALAEAQGDLQRALYLDPDFIVAHFAQGNLARRIGKRREAERAFRNCLRLLHQRAREEIVPESEGISAGRLREIITAMQSEVAAA
jgi:chemotaxis protein methyltransferase CheR